MTIGYAGRTALVTGASSGIGRSFARALAARGAAVILVARREAICRELARELAAAHGVAAEAIGCDLSRAGAGDELYERVSALGRTVDILVNNAGAGLFGAFHQLPADAVHAQVMLNVVALQDLTRAFLPGMVRQGRGAAINVSSVVAFMPLPYQAVYAASKAFVLTLSEGLAGEYHGTGIQVLAV